MNKQEKPDARPVAKDKTAPRRKPGHPVELVEEELKQVQGGLASASYKIKIS